QAGYARWTHWQYHQPSYCFECIPGLEEQLFRIVRPYQGSGRYFLWQSRTTDPACNRYRDQPEGYQVFSGNKNGCCRKYPNVYNSRQGYQVAGYKFFSASVRGQLQSGSGTQARIQYSS